MSKISDLMELAQSAAKSAGKALAARGEGFGSIDKMDGRDIKLSADKAAEAIILEALKATDIPILSEEEGWIGTPADQYWLVDPLDGSANYNRQIPICCVSIALMEKDRAILGVIHDFNHGDLYSGSIEQAAQCNGIAMSVTDTEMPEQSILMTGLPVARDYSGDAMAAFGKELSRWRKVRMIGSAAMAACYVARGYADCYREDASMLWDIAAACAIIEAAGGKVQLTPAEKPNAFDVVATNGVVRL